ncbi:hypothetical protein B0H12DRAFT_139805 [Mycena haematopus]|nr:hypothetical protein B0H12DRAFT_139805 [Mycena haematopus]
MPLKSTGRALMFPTTSNRSSNSLSPTTTPRPGHQRNRIACLNCRKKKVKCTTAGKQPQSPCERCVKEDATCQYVAISNDEESNFRSSQGPPAPIWVEPLSPESYAQSKDVFPRQPQVPQTHPGHQYHPPTTGPPWGQTVPPSGNPHSGYPYPALNSTGPSRPGTEFSPATTPLYLANSAPPYVHYGPFPGPANTVYPWTRRQSE